jgi:hypothetical protein
VADLAAAQGREAHVRALEVDLVVQLMKVWPNLPDSDDNDESTVNTKGTILGTYAEHRGLVGGFGQHGARAQRWEAHVRTVEVDLVVQLAGKGGQEGVGAVVFESHGSFVGGFSKGNDGGWTRHVSLRTLSQEEGRSCIDLPRPRRERACHVTVNVATGGGQDTTMSVRYHITGGHVSS